MDPPSLWTTGCLRPDIHPPNGAFMGPYACTGIAPSSLLPKGQAWLPNGPTPGPAVGTLDIHTPLEEAQPLISLTSGIYPPINLARHPDLLGGRDLAQPLSDQLGSLHNDTTPHMGVHEAALPADAHPGSASMVTPDLPPPRKQLDRARRGSSHKRDLGCPHLGRPPLSLSSL